jgi:hypothetical protein
MWQKCQILVPSPMWQPGSKMALGWAKKWGFSINLSKASPSKGRKGFSEKWWQNFDNQAIEKIIITLNSEIESKIPNRAAATRLESTNYLIFYKRKQV